MSSKSRQRRALRRLEQSKQIMKKSSSSSSSTPNVQVQITSQDSENTTVNVYCDCDCKHKHKQKCDDLCPEYDELGYPYWPRPVYDCVPVHTPYGPSRICVWANDPYIRPVYYPYW